MSMVAIKYQDASTGSIASSEVQKITSGAVHVADQAVHPGEDSTLDRQWGGAKATKGVSTSSGTLKASAGVVYGLFCTTSGDLEIKDGNTAWARFSLTAQTLLSFPAGITHTTNISFSASAAVATVFYT